MDDPTYDDGSTQVPPSYTAAAEHPSQRAGRRRRAPSPEEQKRREAWGKEWSQFGREHAKLRGWTKEKQ